MFTTRRKSWNRNWRRLAEIVVADAGPLIAFARLDLLSLLPEILGRIIVPDMVLKECLHIPARPDAVAIKSAVDVGVLTVQVSNDTHLEGLSPSLGAGEQAAISIALNIDCAVLMDDKLARRAATHLGLQVIGTGGVLIKARQMGRISEVAPLLEQLRTKGYHLSSGLIARILQYTGEA